jgi:hypothetical protein
MSSRFLYSLSLSSLLALASCGDDPSTTRETDNVTADDEDSTAEGDQDDDPKPPADAGKPRIDAGKADASKPPENEPPADAGNPPKTNADSGAGDSGNDAGKPLPTTGEGMCCDDGDCLCHGDVPSQLTSENGPFETMSYDLREAGCIYYPTDAEPPFAAVAISDGFGGSGGCRGAQTGGWGPFYASWGIVTMIIHTGSGDQPNQRGSKLTAGIAAFKAENMKSGSPLAGKLSGRYGTSGFSMGGGGTSYSSAADKTLKSSVALMPWQPVKRGIEVPTLIVCGTGDGLAPCTATHGLGMYDGIADSVPKMRILNSNGHIGQPSAGGGQSGRVGLAFQKVFLEGDTRWRPLLVGTKSEATNIK